MEIFRHVYPTACFSLRCKVGGNRLRRFCIKSSVATLAEIHYTNPHLKGWAFGGAKAFDTGNMIEKKQGILSTHTKTRYSKKLVSYLYLLQREAEIVSYVESVSVADFLFKAHLNHCIYRRVNPHSNRCRFKLESR
jgi:hypothetical protein